MTKNRGRAEEAFSILFGEDASDEQRRRLMDVQKALGLASTDAMWLILIALEYHLRLYERIPARIEKTLETGIEQARDRIHVISEEAKADATRGLVESVKAVLPKVSEEVGKREKLRWRTRSLTALSIVFAAFVVSTVGVALFSFDRGLEAGAKVDPSIIEWATSLSGTNARALDGRGLLQSITSEQLRWMTSLEGQRGYALARDGMLRELDEWGVEWLMSDGGELAREIDRAGFLNASTLEKLRWINREGKGLYDASRAGVFLKLETEDLVWLLSDEGALAREMDEAGMLNADSISKLQWLENLDGQWVYGVAQGWKERDWRGFREFVEGCTRKRSGVLGFIK